MQDILNNDRDFNFLLMLFYTYFKGWFFPLFKLKYDHVCVFISDRNNRLSVFITCSSILKYLAQYYVND